MSRQGRPLLRIQNKIHLGGIMCFSSVVKDISVLHLSGVVYG